jgi:integrase/recombinase XerD
MEQKEYRASTQEKFRQVLKLFYKTVYGQGESCPDAVKWLSTKLAKEKAGTHTETDLSEYLDETEVKRVIEAAPTVQKRAFLSALYETGARPEEFLRLTNKDIAFNTNGIVVMLRGKTGERRGMIIAFSKIFQEWLAMHPLREDNEYPIWISEATNCKNQPLGLRGAEKIIEKAMSKAGLRNKHARLYIMRHSRATFLAPRMQEAQLCLIFGWVIGTKVVRRYIHMSGINVDATLVAISQGSIPKPEESKMKTMICSRCSE